MGGVHLRTDVQMEHSSVGLTLPNARWASISASTVGAFGLKAKLLIGACGLAHPSDARRAERVDRQMIHSECGCHCAEWTRQDVVAIHYRELAPGLR